MTPVVYQRKVESEWSDPIGYESLADCCEKNGISYSSVRNHMSANKTTVYAKGNHRIKKGGKVVKEGYVEVNGMRVPIK